MLNKTHAKLFNATIEEIANNTELERLTENEAFRKFILLQSILYEKYTSAIQDEMLDGEKRLRAAECLKLVDSTLNFFSEFKKDIEQIRE